MSTHEERKNKIDKQFSEIMKVGLQKWLIINRKIDVGWNLHSEIGEFYDLYDKVVVPIAYDGDYEKRKKLDEIIERYKTNDYISDKLYYKWEEIRDEERIEEEEGAGKRKKEFENRVFQKEKEINNVIERLIQKLLLTYSVINN